MKYRRLGKTDLVVSEVGFGLWSVSTASQGRLDERDSIALLNRAFGLGVSFFDTADVYGDGYGEEVVFKALGQHRHDMVVGTKFGYDFYTHWDTRADQVHPQDFSPSFARYACEQSLRRLRTDYIDLYQLHHPRLEAIQDDDLFETLEALVKEGKVRYYGCALGPGTGRFEEGEACLRRGRVSSLQVVYNILEQEPARRFFPIAQEEGTGLLSRLPHVWGLLDGTYARNRGTPLAGQSSQGWLEAGLKRVEGLDFLTQESDATMGQIAIKFVLAREEVASALPNITTLEQLEELAIAPETPDLTAEALGHIADLYDHAPHLGETEEQATACGG